MSCQNCEEEKKQEELGDKFGDDLAKLLEKYRGKLNSIDLSHALILEAKIEMCCVSEDFIRMFGILVHMTTHDLQEMWEEMKPTEEELSKKTEE